MTTEQVRTEPRRLISKVPQVTLVFWVIKVLTTGMGEATSDHSCSTTPIPASWSKSRSWR
jgi:uncharacterized membrane-anchored protein